MDIGTSKIITKKEEFNMGMILGKVGDVLRHPVALLLDLGATAAGAAAAGLLYKEVGNGVKAACQYIDDQNTMVTVKTGIIKTETMTLADWKRRQKGGN